jgi:hypothetical protein
MIFGQVLYEAKTASQIEHDVAGPVNLVILSKVLSAAKKLLDPGTGSTV